VGIPAPSFIPGDLNVSSEAAIVVSAKALWGAVVAVLLSLLTGWKLFFSHKIQQLDELNNSVRDIDVCLKAHIQSEERKLDKIHARLDDIWKFLAGDK